ncbi:glycoside hydrolase superfamily, partial [Phakopsora pachyrhizi]
MFQWNYKDIGNECGNFLGTNGYRYVQISPPQEHILGDQWWKDYQPVSYKIGSRRGTEAELKEMIDKCEKSGVGVIADVVLNHMTAGSPSETRIGSLGSEFKKYDYKFNGYTRGDFHDCGRNGNNLISNYSDRYEVQNCELAGLSDLNTSKESVRRTIKRYLNRLIELGIRGFRIDAAKHMDSIDVKNFLKDIPVRVVQEVIYGFSEPIQPIEYLSNGRVHIFRGASELRRMFMNDGIAYLASPNPWGERWGSGYLPGSHSQVFITNWDMERGGTVALRFDMEPQIYILAQVFVLTWDYGQIDIYSGYNFTSYDDGPEQASVECGRYGWRCEHRNPVIVGAVKLRSHISNEPVTNIMTSGIQRLAFNRGSKAFIAINNEDSEWILDGIEVKL